MAAIEAGVAAARRRAMFWRLVLQALRLRRQRPELFGGYRPVFGEGRCGEHLLGFPVEARGAQPRRGVGCLAGVQHVQGAAVAAQGDDLPAEPIDHLGVVGPGVAC